MYQKELLTYLEEFIPLNLATSWDNSGLQVASLEKDIRHLAVALDPCVRSVEKALALGADFIFTHHPLSLSPRLPSRLDAYHKILSLLFKNDVSLFAAHTNLDSLPVAHWLADELGLLERNFLEVTGEYQELPAGIGCVGSLAQKTASEEFIKKVQKLVPHSANFNLAGKLPEFIEKVAICGGSGSSLVPVAEKFGADIFITGDVKYHSALDVMDSLDAFDANYGQKFPCFLDVGHFSLEEEMMRRFSLMLQEKLDNVRVSFISANDPFLNITE